MKVSFNPIAKKVTFKIKLLRNFFLNGFLLKMTVTIIRIIAQCRRNQGYISKFSVNSLIIYDDTIDHSRANPYNIIQFTFNKLDHVFSYLVCISPYTKWSANSSSLEKEKNMAYLCAVCFSKRDEFSRVLPFSARDLLFLSLFHLFFLLFSGWSFMSWAKYDAWLVRRVQFYHRSRLGTLTSFLGPNMGLDSSRWGTQVHQLRSFRSRYYTEQWIVKISLLPSHRGCGRFDAFLFRLYLFSRDIENFPV